MKAIVLAAMIAFGVSVTFGQVTSLYSSTRTSACRTVGQSNDEGGWYEGQCRGVGGYKVILTEGDIRQTLTIVTPAGKKQELNFWGFYGGFSSIGEKIEWRIRKGVPFALIARFNVADPEDARKSTSFLMISKISTTESCVTDVVPPMSNQNEKARELSDGALAKPCKAPQ